MRDQNQQWAELEDEALGAGNKNKCRKWKGKEQEGTQAQEDQNKAEHRAWVSDRMLAL